VIEASTDLTNWVAVATSIPLVPPVAKRPVTVNATNSLSFYRAYATGSSAAMQPRLSAPSFAAGQFHFILNGTANTTYIIQATTDLKNWAPVTTNTSASATRAIDVIAPNSQSLYRALVAP